MHKDKDITLFVAFSHVLTEAQIQDAKASLGVTRIVTLGEVNPELQALFSQVPATATTVEIQVIAARVVIEAELARSSVFYCTGEPSVMFWANTYGMELSMRVVQSTTERRTTEVVQPDGSVLKTQVFAHVQWRDLF